MRKISGLVLSLTVTILSSCGSSTPAFINGHWNASLSPSGGLSGFGFGAAFRQKSGSILSVSNLSFNPSQSCFSGPTNTAATFASTGKINGVQMGNFTMTISSASPGAIQNTLALQGNAQSNNTISGTWTLGGAAGCNGNGTFVLTPLVVDPA